MEKSDNQVDAFKPKCGLLTLLPKPKNQAPLKSKPASVMLPPTIQKNTSAAAKKKSPVKPDPSLRQKASHSKLSLVDYGSSGSSQSSENEDEENREEESSSDFFGIKSNKIQKLDVTDPIHSSSTEHIHDVEYGPQKQETKDHGYPTMDAVYDDHPNTSGAINDSDASEMIYKKELAPFGASSIAAREAVLNMIDVSVDKLLGPHVQANLLKNLNNKVMAQVSIGPLPKVKKDPKDRLSKRKHQITHLAGLAVAREETLQEQWADNRQKKKASSKRYGF